MRKTCLRSVYELALEDERICFIGSDLGAGTLSEFQCEMPGRFFMEGIAEAHVIGMAAGLAMNGKIPYVNTIATFLTRRCLEQVVVDLCMHKLNVRLLGNGGGLVYAPLGPTHEAVEDIALMRSIPEMTVVAPCDSVEMKRIMRETPDYPGPVYIRIAKGFDPVVSSRDLPCKIGSGVLLKPAGDAVIITTGIILETAIEASRSLDLKGISTGVLHLHTIKPLDVVAVVSVLEKASVVVTVEEHSRVGGLGSAVAEVISETLPSNLKSFERFGIPDVFPDAYGSQKSLMKRFGITAEGIVEHICREFRNKGGVSLA